MNVKADVVRKFDFAMITENGVSTGRQAFPNAKIPMYMDTYAAGADFFCAEAITIPSVWSSVAAMLEAQTTNGRVKNIMSDEDLVDSDAIKGIKPTLVHTGIKAQMYENEVLYLFNRSSNPKNGLVLANGVGVIDSSYYGNPSNDGEIMFAFFNVKPYPVTLRVGDRIGQGVFQTFSRPVENLLINDATRTGGFGSTGRG